MFTKRAATRRQPELIVPPTRMMNKVEILKRSPEWTRIINAEYLCKLWILWAQTEPCKRRMDHEFNKNFDWAFEAFKESIHEGTTRDNVH